jgi:hypothetical protein
LFALIFVSSFVSAASDASQALTPIVDMATGVINAVIDFVKPIAGALVNETDTSKSNEIFLGKVLLVILLMSIVYVVLSKSMEDFFADKVWALWIVSVAVSLIGIRFLKADMIYATIIPSSTFAVAVSAGLPFVLYFFLVGGFPKVIRKYCWIFFGVIFLGIWMLRLPDLTSSGAKMIYPLTVVLSLIMAFADGTMRKWMYNLRLQKAKRGLSGRQIGIYQAALNQVYNTYQGFVSAGNPNGYLGTTPGNVGPTKKGDKAYQKDVKYYEDKINALLHA